MATPSHPRKNLCIALSSAFFAFGLGWTNVNAASPADGARPIRSLGGGPSDDAPIAMAGPAPPDARDTGPSSVDVSSFPPPVQAAYAIFSQRCSRCHTLARPINTDLSPSAWKGYVKKMMNKPGSGISPEQGKVIYKFLKYYQAHKDKLRGK
ncbi:MAG: hypothetical protein V3V08_17275 [Nannocystaceae bacterium]